MESDIGGPQRQKLRTEQGSRTVHTVRNRIFDSRGKVSLTVATVRTHQCTKEEQEIQSVLLTVTTVGANDLKLSSQLTKIRELRRGTVGVRKRTFEENSFFLSSPKRLKKKKTEGLPTVLAV